VNVEDQRLELMRACVRHVTFDGWSERALKAGAKDVGMAVETAKTLFPNTGHDLVTLHCQNADAEALDCLGNQDLTSMRVRERVTMAIRTRIEIVRGDREAVRQAVSMFTLPGNATLGARLLFGTVDRLWRAAGDTSTDWNYYSKRGLLAGVYGSTVLYWLQDNSEDFVDSWLFLDRRIADVMKVPKIIGSIRKVFSPLRRRGFRQQIIRTRLD
jgi:ubiquinone biosynthesis protein COQ9